MNLTIILYRSLGGTSYTGLESNRLHGILLDTIPSISQRLEDNLGSFVSGDLAFTARNLDVFWTTRFFSLDLYERWPNAYYIDIRRGTFLLWSGMIDYRSISFNAQEQTCSFTALGLTSILERYSAEVVRRSIPALSDWDFDSLFTGGHLYSMGFTKTWTTNQWVNHCLIDHLGAVFTITSNGAYFLTVASGTPANGAYRIRPFVWKTAEYVGQYGSGASGHLVDTVAQGWTTNCWTGYYLFDSDGNSFPIGPNTPTDLSVTGTPASGHYSIRAANYARLMESLGPAVANLNLQPGDKLSLAVAAHSGVRALSWDSELGGGVIDPSQAINLPKQRQGTWIQPRATIARQTVEIQYVGPRTTAPTLNAQQVWLKDDLAWDFSPGDGCYCVTPYHRDKTVSELVTLLGAEVGVVPHIDPQSYATNVVPYADFDGKSLADALSELASITNSVIFFHRGTSNLIFQRRDEGYSPLLKTLDGYLTEESQETAWEHWYQAVRVAGADNREVTQGALRHGSETLEVSSNFIGSWTWVKQVCDRLLAFFSQRRTRAKLGVKAEYPHPQTDEDWTQNEIGASPPRWWAAAWAYITSSVWALASGGYVECKSGTSPVALVYTPATGHADSDTVVTCRINMLGHACGAAARVSGYSATRNAYIAAILVDTAGNSGLYIVKYNSGVGGTIIGSWLTAPPVTGTTYCVRLQVIGTALKAKFWNASGSEFFPWMIEVTDTSLVGATDVGLYDNFINSSNGCYFYRWQWYGKSFKHFGFELMDRISYSGQEWIVIGVDEPIEQTPAVVKLDALALNGVACTPSEGTGMLDTTTPEPPVIVEVTDGSGEWFVDISWAGDYPSLLGFYRTVWAKTVPRPGESAGEFRTIAYSGTLARWVDDQVLISGGGSSTHYVDYQAVLLDGRLSQPCDPYLLP